MAILLLLTLASVADVDRSPAVRHEAIHPPSRVFTADEFREFLQARRFQQTLQRFAESSLSDEQRRRLAEFAERLVDQSQSPGEKKELKAPEELLKNPAIAEMLRDEKAIERLLQNKALMDLAERIARNYKLSNAGGGPGEALPSGVAPPRRERTPTASPRPGARSAETPPPQGADPAPTRSPGSPSGAPGRSAADAPAVGEEPQSPVAAGAQQAGGVREGVSRDDGSRRAADGPEGARGGGGASPRREGASAGGGGHALLRRWAETAQRIGPLQNSRAFEAFERSLDQGAGAELPLPSRSAAAGLIESLRWPELPRGDAISGVLGRFGDSSLTGVNLPSGLAQWAPSLARLPIPPLPAPSMTLMTPPAPRMPTWSASPLSAGGAGAFAGLLAFVVAAALFWGWGRTKYGASWRLGFARFPDASAMKRPDSPLDPSSRSSIRAWFEYLVLRCLGESARPKNHRALVELLRGESSADARSAVDLAELYEQARYWPPSEPLEPRVPSR